MEMKKLMEEIKKRTEERQKCKRSLIEQMDLLSKASKELKYDEGLSSYSEKMATIYKSLELPFLFVIFTLFLNLSVCFVVFVCGFFWRKKHTDVLL